MAILRVKDITLECVKGDIADQADMEAIVNAANARLLPGGGVAGAIHRAAGPGLEKECRPFAPIQPGEAVITGGHNLPNRHVIHCLGPVYGKDEPADIFLANCYCNALRAKSMESDRLLSLPFRQAYSAIPSKKQHKLRWTPYLTNYLAYLPSIIYALCCSVKPISTFMNDYLGSRTPNLNNSPKE